MTSPAPVEPSATLEVEALGKRLGSHRVLRGAALRVEAGEVCAVVGENGAGKSTLLRVVAGVLVADAGDVRIAGASLRGERRRALAALGYAPEHADLPDVLRASEWLALIHSLKRASARGPAARPARPSSAAGAGDALDLASFVHQRLGSLSLGQRRRVALAAALAGAPALLVLDEPTNGLDVETLDRVVAVVGGHVAAGGAVLLATHDLGFARRVGARVVRLHEGALAPEPPDRGR